MSTLDLTLHQRAAPEIAPIATYVDEDDGAYWVGSVEPWCGD